MRFLNAGFSSLDLIKGFGLGSITTQPRSADSGRAGGQGVGGVVVVARARSVFTVTCVSASECAVPV